jgi:hypothetical protein
VRQTDTRVKGVPDFRLLCKVEMAGVGRLTIKKTFALSPDQMTGPNCHTFICFVAPVIANRPGPLKCVGKLYHALALVRIGQWPAHGTEIIGHVQGVGSARDYGGHPRIAEQILQEELRPAVGKAVRPVGNLPAAHRAKQPGAAKRQRGKNGDFDFGGRRQNAFFDFTIVERLIDLHEVGLFAP